MKKTLLGLGTLAILAPIAAVVSCSDDKVEEPDKGVNTSPSTANDNLISNAVLVGSSLVDDINVKATSDDDVTYTFKISKAGKESLIVLKESKSGNTMTIDGMVSNDKADVVLAAINADATIKAEADKQKEAFEKPEPIIEHHSITNVPSTFNAQQTITTLQTAVDAYATTPSQSNMDAIYALFTVDSNSNSVTETYVPGKTLTLSGNVLSIGVLTNGESVISTTYTISSAHQSQPVNQNTNVQQPTQQQGQHETQQPAQQQVPQTVIKEIHNSADGTLAPITSTLNLNALKALHSGQHDATALGIVLPQITNGVTMTLGPTTINGDVITVAYTLIASDGTSHLEVTSGQLTIIPFITAEEKMNLLIQGLSSNSLPGFHPDPTKLSTDSLYTKSYMLSLINAIDGIDVALGDLLISSYAKDGVYSVTIRNHGPNKTITFHGFKLGDAYGFFLLNSEKQINGAKAYSSSGRMNLDLKFTTPKGTLEDAKSMFTVSIIKSFFLHSENFTITALENTYRADSNSFYIKYSVTNPVSGKTVEFLVNFNYA